MKFIAQVTSSGPDIAEAHTFLRDTSEVAFLFKGRRIPDFLKKLYQEAIDLCADFIRRFFDPLERAFHLPARFEKSSSEIPRAGVLLLRRGDRRSLKNF